MNLILVKLTAYSCSGTRKKINRINKYLRDKKNNLMSCVLFAIGSFPIKAISIFVFNDPQNIHTPLKIPWTYHQKSDY